MQLQQARERYQQYFQNKTQKTKKNLTQRNFLFWKMNLTKLNEDYEHGANGKYFCKCCGFNTLSEFPNGTYEICEICFWEDDKYQTENPNEKSSPNRVSLIQARKNFEEFGACELEMKTNVRKPNENDIRKI